jgi:hypothetical protein
MIKSYTVLLTNIQTQLTDWNNKYALEENNYRIFVNRHVSDAIVLSELYMPIWHYVTFESIYIFFFHQKWYSDLTFVFFSFRKKCLMTCFCRLLGVIRLGHRVHPSPCRSQHHKRMIPVFMYRHNWTSLDRFVVIFNFYFIPESVFLFFLLKYWS